jgi:hypothetical protein
VTEGYEMLDTMRGKPDRVAKKKVEKYARQRAKTNPPTFGNQVLEKPKHSRTMDLEDDMMFVMDMDDDN